jgi:hypothetical protein
MIHEPAYTRLLLHAGGPRGKLHGFRGRDLAVSLPDYLVQNQGGF